MLIYSAGLFLSIQGLGFVSEYSHLPIFSNFTFDVPECQLQCNSTRAQTPRPLYMSHPHVNLSRIHVDLARLLHAQECQRICKMHAKV